MAFAAASTNVGIWQLDVAADRLWMTEHCRAMFGVPGNTIPTMRTLFDAVHPDDRQALEESVRSAKHFGLPIDQRISRRIVGQRHALVRGEGPAAL